MGISEQQRQKKLQQKKKKRKKIQSSGGSSERKASTYAKFPIHECLVPEKLFEDGIGTVIWTRRTPQHSIAVSAFVVDVLCLGVKNALFNVSSEHHYESTVKPRLTAAYEDQAFEEVHPSCARKLIEGATSYAQNLGFTAHRDYRHAQGIFGDTDAQACPTQFTYGRNGMPFYIRGPNESISQARRIIDQLHSTCGEGNFHYLVETDESPW